MIIFVINISLIQIFHERPPLSPQLHPLATSLNFPWLANVCQKPQPVLTTASPAFAPSQSFTSAPVLAWILARAHFAVVEDATSTQQTILVNRFTCSTTTIRRMKRTSKACASRSWMYISEIGSTAVAAIRFSFVERLILKRAQEILPNLVWSWGIVSMVWLSLVGRTASQIAIYKSAMPEVWHKGDNPSMYMSLRKQTSVYRSK